VDTNAARMPDERRSLIGLFSDLWRETSRLIHAEVELASVEISEKVSDLGTGLVAMLIGGAVLFAGFLVLLFAAAAGVYLLLQSQTEHALWAAPAIVGAAVVVAGAIAIAKGRSEFKAANLKPEKTLKSLQRDAQLVREHIR
jgi:uncharacterized membrane protein YqjE